MRVRKPAEPDFGVVLSADDATLSPDDALIGRPDDVQDTVTDEGNALWSYHNENRINGIPVEESARRLKIDKDDMLAVAFVLDREPKSAVIYMSPDKEDGVRVYDEILKKVYNGEAVIIDEMKQFDPQKGCFVAWVRYDLLRYVLHPRFNYLRKE